MSNRMTDERLDSLTALVFPSGRYEPYDLVSEIMQALTAERDECSEQARLLGISAEKELRLLTRIRELEAQRDEGRELVSAWSERCEELQRKYEALVTGIESTAKYFDANDGWAEANLLRALLEELNDE